jgi:hypothetical protein
VLPGVVIAAEQARPFLDRGAAQLAAHNSGRARMAITASVLEAGLHRALAAETADLPAPLVVRSSSVLEGSGTWSGAFTSYLDVRHEELPKAVLGCYASVFTQATVARFEAAGVSPAAAGMAVLVQPVLDPDCGGTARIVGGEVLVAGIQGSPVPLVQGWEPGEHAKVSADGNVRGEAAIESFGRSTIGEVAATLRRSQELIGANSCEWAVADGRVWLLQIQRRPAPPIADRGSSPPELDRSVSSSSCRGRSPTPRLPSSRSGLPTSIPSPPSMRHKRSPPL